jgi:hypothetical protein
MLATNRSKQTKRAQIEELVEQVEQEICDAEASKRTMTDRLDALCVEAKRGTHSELEEAQRRSADYLRIKAAIEATEREILEAGEGRSIADLEAEAQGIEPDLLAGRIKQLRSVIEEELEPRHTELAKTKGREEKELELMDGVDHAAVLADEARAILAVFVLTLNGTLL